MVQINREKIYEKKREYLLLISREYKDGCEEDSAKERSESHCNFELFCLFHFLPKQRRANLGHCVFLLLFLRQKRKKEKKKDFKLKERIRVIWSTRAWILVTIGPLVGPN